MSTLTLETVPGFANLPDAAFEAEKPASGVNLIKVSENAAFGLVRTEFFVGIYKHGDQVPLPVSERDGYAYSREELIYSWGLYSTFNPSSGWITGPDSLWYAAWLVNQADGKVYSVEWYRRSSNANPNGTQSNDGQLMVFTIGQRLSKFAIPSAPPNFPDLPDNDLQCSGSVVSDSNVLRLPSALVPRQRYTLSRLSLKASETVNAFNCTSAALLKTASDSDTVVEVVPITFNGGSPSHTAVLGEVVVTDPIFLKLEPGFDYYYVVACNNIYGVGGISRAKGNIASTGNPGGGSPSYSFMGGDWTQEAAPVGQTGLFTDFNPSYPQWELFSALEFSEADTEAPAQFNVIDAAHFYQDRPLNTTLAKQLNQNSKYSIFNTEVIYMGEFVDGDTIPNPVSPADGTVYDYSQCKFQHSWRWTTYGSTFKTGPDGLPTIVQPALDLGQLDRLNALVTDSTGDVAIDVQYYPAHGSLPSHAAGHGRLSVVAFCTRGNYVEVTGS